MPSKGHRKKHASSGNGGGASILKKVIVTSLVTICLLGGIILLYIFLPIKANQASQSAIIRIPAAATTQNVNDTLSKYLGDKYASKVMLMAKFRGTDFSKRHGAYMVDSGMSPMQAERKLSVGQQHPVKIVINGVRGLNRLADNLSSKLDFSADSLKNTLENSEILSQYLLTPPEALSLFIDDTYETYWSSSPEAIISKIGKNYKKVWNAERLEKAEKLNLTPAEVMILASIVDEETNKYDEKGMIARLYINRLRKNMKLQADPTVKFALQDFSLRRIRGSHLEVESPYNTYKVAGLPPGQIRTVTVADIDAVLNAPEHEYLYMCAKDDFSGYHNFAKDYATHQQNARKYQKALNKRNIK